MILDCQGNEWLVVQSAKPLGVRTIPHQPTYTRRAAIHVDSDLLPEPGEKHEEHARGVAPNYPRHNLSGTTMSDCLPNGQVGRQSYSSTTQVVFGYIGNIKNSQSTVHLVDIVRVQ